MKHLVFDVNAIVGLWLDREKSDCVEELLQSDDKNVKCWIAASSIPTIEYVFISEIKREGGSRKEALTLIKKLYLSLFNKVDVLSIFGFDRKVLIEQATDTEDAQIALAADQLHGEKLIVTLDRSFDTLGLIETKTPSQTVDWLKQKEDDLSIPFVDLASQQDLLRPDLEKRICRVLNHGKYILGPEVQEFEERLSEYVGVEHSIGVSSGTDALLTVLMALDIGPGDAVFTTPFTFIATAEVISLLGATPVFVDIDPRTFNVDPAQLALAVQAVQNLDSSIYPLPKFKGCDALNPKAIIPVDLFGLPADYDPIMNLAEKNSLFVLEDAAQGLGGIYKGRMAGSLGHAAATSFFPAKPLGCYGDGGAVMTDDAGLAEEIRSIRVHGKGKDKYDNVRIGLNARLHTLQAAILLAKLANFPQEVKTRREIADKYAQILDEKNGIQLPCTPSGLQSAWAQYSILHTNRGAVQAKLSKENIPSAVYYPKPLHLQSAFTSLLYESGRLPISERVSSSIVSFPIHPYLNPDDIGRVSFCTLW